MKRLLHLAALLLLFAVGTYAQSNGVYSDVAWRFSTGFPNYPVGGATITVCTYPATSPAIPCTNLATVYGGPTTAVHMSNPFTADQTGNFSFWAAPGNYIITITGNSVIPYAKTITVPCGAGFGCTTGAFNRLNSVGTQLKTSDFTILGWGTGATITSASGTDTAFTITITAGTTPSIVPTVTLTFHDGPWTSITTSQAQMTGGTGNVTDIETTNNLSTITLSYMGLPIATKTYTLTAILTGTSNLVPTQQIASLNPVVQNPATSQVVSQPLGTTLSVSSLNNILTVDGVQYTTFASAFAACPSTGCTIDMRGNPNTSALALGTIDVGNTGPAMTLLLGPFKYTATQIVMRTGTKIIGMGFLASPQTVGTTITATSTSNPLIVANTNASTDYPSQHIELKDIQFIGAANGSNTSDGMFFDASVSTTGLGGVWYSQFSGLTFSKFAGSVIHLKGPSTAGHNGDNQWLTFSNTTVFRTLGGGNALRIEGTNNFVTFINSELDGYLGNGAIDPTATPNIFIGGGPGTSSAGAPYIIDFIDTAIQGSNVLVQVDGGYSIKFDHCHHEAANGVFHVTQNQNGANIPTVGLLVDGESFNGNVGVNTGNGYIMQLDAGVAATNVTVQNSIYPTSGAAPDNWLVNNSTSSSGINFSNNTFGGGAGGAGAGTHIPVDGPVHVSGDVGFTSMGTGPSVTSIKGTDKAFILVFSTGTGSPSNGAGITINFREPNFSQPPVCIANRTDTQPQQFSYIYNLPGSTTNAVFSTSGTAPAASTSYGISVICVGKPN